MAPRTTPRILAATGLIALAAGFAALAIGGVAPVLAQPGQAGEAVRTALAARGPMVLPEERALIDLKCGYAPGEAPDRSIRMESGILFCANGRRIDDPEVRAVADAIGDRARTHVREVMASAEVRRAISAETRAGVETAMRRLRNEGRQDIARAVAAARVHARESAAACAAAHDADAIVAAAMAQAEAALAAMDFEAIQRDVDRALDQADVRQNRRAPRAY